ncbi:MAG: N-acetylneuraminate synthase family protein [Deltaproteobacteria bacterium]|nr:N-acetylneuraminate synthase family protein [Deltaproteobacteria bacterium]
MSRHTVRIRNHAIGNGHPVFVVAEIGASHGGKIDRAVKLIEEAAGCGVQAVKLQTVNVDDSYVGGTESYEIFKGLWFRKEDLERLVKVAEANHVVLFSTPGDFCSFGLIRELKMPLVKISSGLLTHEPLIKEIAKSGLPILFSTGMSYLDEVGSAVRVAESNGCSDIMLMHCTSLYPAAPETLNLRAMEAMEAAFPYPVGYSDHSLGETAAVAACALGASLIEKHFVLDKAYSGPDSHFSHDPKELKHLVEEIRNVEKMLGSPVKRPTEEEMAIRNRYRRCLVARKVIRAGKRIDRDMVAVKRVQPGQCGLAPRYYEDILGLRVRRDINTDEPLLLHHFCD